MVGWCTRKNDDKIVVAAVKNNISLLVWRKDDKKIVGVMAMVDEGRQHNHEGGAGGGYEEV